jgi:hypothetical protein
MTAIRKTPTLLFSFVVAVVLIGCASSAPTSPSKTSPATPPITNTTATNTTLYYLHAGGPSLIVGFDTWPASNRLSMTLLSSADGVARFRLTNQEPTTILIWNVRTQVRSIDTATKEVVWTTKHDDYPSIDPTAKLLPGGTATLNVPYARPMPWRLCLIYSKEQQHRNSTNRGIFGDYEVISREIDE